MQAYTRVTKRRLWPIVEPQLQKEQFRLCLGCGNKPNCDPIQSMCLVDFECTFDESLKEPKFLSNKLSVCDLCRQDLEHLVGGGFRWCCCSGFPSLDLQKLGKVATSGSKDSVFPETCWSALLVRIKSLPQLEEFLRVLFKSEGDMDNEIKGCTTSAECRVYTWHCRKETIKKEKTSECHPLEVFLALGWHVT